jgi:hypothetical protein
MQSSHKLKQHERSETDYACDSKSQSKSSWMSWKAKGLQTSNGLEQRSLAIPLRSNLVALSNLSGLNGFSRVRENPQQLRDFDRQFCTGVSMIDPTKMVGLNWTFGLLQVPSPAGCACPLYTPMTDLCRGAHFKTGLLG